MTSAAWAAKPSHPELLDWLAVTFRDDLGGSLKKLHKLIVMSRPTAKKVQTRLSPGNKSDAANMWLSHQNRRKLDAESIRDSILAVSGKLDLTMGGPSFQDFIIDKPQHSPHYEYHLHDPEDPEEPPPQHLPLHRAQPAAAFHDRARLRRSLHARGQAQRIPQPAASARDDEQRPHRRPWRSTSPRVSMLESQV
jgi:hypothetical protein